jgi:catechol 2,3-dioxygenase-like lactoylglutathione lyase family enzyme
MNLTDAHVQTRVPARDLDRARRFYAEKLGLEPAEERSAALLYRCGGDEFAIFSYGGRDRRQLHPDGLAGR